jgi:hypothetical protein
LKDEEREGGEERECVCVRRVDSGLLLGRLYRSDHMRRPLRKRYFCSLMSCHPGPGCRVWRASKKSADAHDTTLSDGSGAQKHTHAYPRTYTCTEVQEAALFRWMNVVALLGEARRLALVEQTTRTTLHFGYHTCGRQLMRSWLLRLMCDTRNIIQ